MLWMNKTGAVSPISSYQTTVNVEGHSWDIYRDSNGSNMVFSFVRKSNTNSDSVDIKVVSDWLRSNNWFGNVNLHKIEFGFEITSASGGGFFSISGSHSATVDYVDIAYTTNQGIFLEDAFDTHVLGRAMANGNPNCQLVRTTRSSLNVTGCSQVGPPPSNGCN